MNEKSSYDEYKESVLNEYGLNSNLFLQSFLFFINIDNGCTIEEIEAILKSFKAMNPVSRQTLLT